MLGQAEDEGLGGGMGLTGLLSQEEAREILSLEKQTAFNFLSA